MTRPTHPNNLEYQRAAIERERAKGLKRVLVTIPIEREAELKAIVARWRAENRHDDGAT